MEIPFHERHRQSQMRVDIPPVCFPRVYLYCQLGQHLLKQYIVLTLFLEVDTERTWAVASIGPACLSAYLRRAGQDTAFLRIPVDQPPDEFLDSLLPLRPGLIAMSLTTRQWLRGKELAEQIKQQIDVPIVAGGLHPTFAAESVLSSNGFDFVCLGEGEDALAELIDRLRTVDYRSSPVNVRNIWQSGFDRPQLRPVLSPIDNLPFLDRTMLDEQHGVVHMTTQRGCPFPCTYCAARQYSDFYDGVGEYGRRRTPENVLHELEQLRGAGANYVIYLDDTFTIFPSWVKRFSELSAQKCRIPFSIHARPDTVDGEMLDQLAAAGCCHIVYGVESGSERIRKDVLHRPISTEVMVRAFEQTKRAGMIATANYMLGLPGETGEDIEATLSLHDQLMPDDFGYFVFYPYPGTHLFNYCESAGFIPEDYLSLPANHRRSILSMPQLGTDEIAEYFDRFTRIRERDQLKRLGTPSTQVSADLLLEETRKCAALS